MEQYEENECSGCYFYEKIDDEYRCTIDWNNDDDLEMSRNCGFGED